MTDSLAECPCTGLGDLGPVEYREEVLWTLRARGSEIAQYNVCRLCGVQWAYRFGSVPKRESPTELVAAFRVGGENAVLALIAANPDDYAVIRARWKLPDVPR